MGFVVQFAYDYASPLLSAFILGIGTLIVRVILRRVVEAGTIRINQAAELAKFDIQRAQQLAELRTKHLLQIYPKLYDAAHGAAGPFVAYFTTITDQIERLRQQNKDPDETQLRQLFIDYSGAVLSPDGFIVPQGVVRFNNELAEAKLYISDDVNAIAEEMKQETMKLFGLIRREIESGIFEKYSKDQLLDLLNKANLNVSSLNQNKDHLASKINKELAPSL